MRRVLIVVLTISLGLIFLIQCKKDSNSDSSSETSDAGILNFVTPANPTYSGDQNIQVTVKNYDSKVLKSVNIDWSINGKAQKTCKLSSINIASGATYVFIIGTHNFSKDTVYTIKASTSAPNGESDKNTVNDSYTLSNLTVNPASTNPRDIVLQDYKNIYVGLNAYNSGWTGTSASCDAGTITDDFQTRTLQRINYFRKLVGLQAIGDFDAAKNAKCQQGALMCDANGTLNHTPPNTWKCYTADGYQATSHSNLAYGTVGPGAITLYINDFGTGNQICGHRRWILFTKMKVMGHGCTNGFDCLMTVNEKSSDWYSSVPAGTPEFISWPPKDYVPAPLVFARWSFSIPSANFNNATVKMTDSNNNDVPLSIVSYKDNGFGDNTIVWEPTGINLSSQTDVIYNVKINNVVVGSNTKNYDYNVIIIQPVNKSGADSKDLTGKVL